LRNWCGESEYGIFLTSVKHCVSIVLKMKKQNSQFNLNSQMKQVTPEAWANMKKSMVKGDIQAFLTGPWYLKLFILLLIAFILFVFLNTISSMLSFQDAKQIFPVVPKM
jgi:hypothetical protein